MGLQPRTIAGALAVLATLLLLSPGVRVARAGPDDAAQLAAALSEGPVCSPVPVESGPTPAQILAALKAQAPAEPSGDGPVLLNNRGYNYARTGGADPSALRFEQIREMLRRRAAER